MLARSRDYKKNVYSLLSQRVRMNDNLSNSEELELSNEIEGKYYIYNKGGFNIVLEDSSTLLKDVHTIVVDEEKFVFLSGSGELDSEYCVKRESCFLTLVKMQTICNDEEAHYYIEATFHDFPEHILNYSLESNQRYPIFTLDTYELDGNCVGNLYAYLHPLCVDKVRIVDIVKKNMINVLNTASVIIDELKNSNVRDIGFTRSIINKNGTVLIVDSYDNDIVRMHPIGKKDKEVTATYTKLSRTDYHPVDIGGVVYDVNNETFMTENNTEIPEEEQEILDNMESIIKLHKNLDITDMIRYVKDIIVHGHMHDGDLDLIKQVNKNLNDYITEYFDAFDIDLVANNEVHQKLQEIPEFTAIETCTNEEGKLADAKITVFNPDYMYSIWQVERETANIITMVEKETKEDVAEIIEAEDIEPIEEDYDYNEIFGESDEDENLI